MRVRWTLPAADDLYTITSYINRDSRIGPEWDSNASYFLAPSAFHEVAT